MPNYNSWPMWLEVAFFMHVTLLMWYIWPCAIVHLDNEVAQEKGGKIFSFGGKEY